MTDDTTTRALYETPGVAATYREARALPAVAIRTWVDTFRRALAGLHVRVAIDVGAGTGRFTAVLAAAVGGRVVGIEPIAEMVAVRETTAATFVRGVAEALPLGTGTADVALLSMVYHQLRDRGAAIAELHRVVRPAGLMLLRTPTHETHAEFEWVRFFPETLQVNAGRMPARAEVIDAFAAAGFDCREHGVVRHRIADSLAEYVGRIRQRPFSSMRALPDDVWARRLAEFEEHCRTAPDHPVEEPVNFFVFRRP